MCLTFASYTVERVITTGVLWSTDKKKSYKNLKAFASLLFQKNYAEGWILHLNWSYQLLCTRFTKFKQIFLMSLANSRIRIGIPAQNLDRKVQICILIFCKFSSSFLHPVCQLTSLFACFSTPSTITQWLLLRIFVQKVFETNLNFRYQHVKNPKKK